MNNRRGKTAPALTPSVENLEGRVVLSRMTITSALHHLAHVAKLPGHNAATHTSLTVGSGTLGAPMTFNVTVRASTVAAPRGTVNILDHGQVIDSLTLSPTGKKGVSQASATLTQAAGTTAYFFGKHQITAEFVPTGSFVKSDSAAKSFNITQPTYTTLSTGVKIATVIPGSGAQIQAGQTANLLYTGYLASNGQVFDESSMHGGTPLSFPVGAGQVIPGFDAGTVGMQVGETRLIEIPPAQGYGSTAQGTIPANSTLLFAVTLQSIS